MVRALFFMLALIIGVLAVAARQVVEVRVDASAAPRASIVQSSEVPMPRDEFAVEPSGEVSVAPSSSPHADLAIAPVVERIVEALSMPEPLRNEDISAKGQLTPLGILAETNRERRAAGLAPFARNALLEEAARRKAEDMLARQYFAHTAPTGEDVSDLARGVGYEFIMVGENLALGGYEDDRTLVDAWMGSEGHKANLLHARFTEMGAAAVRGRYEGRDTWIAVQEFGLPSSACPQPDAGLASSIRAHEASLETQKPQLEAARVAAENALPWDAPEAVRAYNDFVERYNAEVRQTKALVERYNMQVRATNACIGAN